MLALLFVILAVAVRLASRPVFWLDFTPLTAALLFFGARTPRKWMWVAVALVAASDVILNQRYGYSVTPDLFITWAWYAGAVLLGSAMLRGEARPMRLTGASLTGSVSFFLVSNFAVWLVWHMYPMTLSGLASCYAAGVPFFRNRVVGDLAFTAVFFGIGALVDARLHRPAEARIKSLR
jgi:hypothetical protein